jgi:hypothetical protein
MNSSNPSWQLLRTKFETLNPQAIRVAYDVYLEFESQFKTVEDYDRENATRIRRWDAFKEKEEFLYELLDAFTKQNVSTEQYTTLLWDSNGDQRTMLKVYKDYYKTVPMQNRPNPAFATTGWGGKGRKRATPKRAAPKWIQTARHVTVKGNRGKPDSTKVVFRNSATGELRVRKMVVRSDGTKRASYVKF